MNKIILFLFLTFSLGFSYELSFNKKFEKSVYPDILQTYVKISIESEDEEYINKNIEKFNKFIKNDNSVIKENGSYVLNPKYRYYKNKQEFMGYIGSLRYEVKSKDAKKINHFLSKLIEIKKEFRTRKVKLNVSNLKWQISENKQEKYIDELRLEAIMWAQDYKKSLSSKLALSCMLKNININGGSNINHFRSVKAMEASAVSNLAPINSSKKVNLNASFIMECK